ncbi:hypothetical protein C2845_PM15G05200 [Panicum miliaceum]|uniref:F-box domain-containing protein n=1 Tax=Panicum miliaceum TaxID=4540 RepID=A0A3L6QBY8_PANMI|nr:hypothetical protein C2845_PM15G05200 [Panicum miliaceum]
MDEDAQRALCNQWISGGFEGGWTRYYCRYLPRLQIGGSDDGWVQIYRCAVAEVPIPIASPLQPRSITMEEPEQEDRISLLPDCLLSSIVHLLPPKAAARTMILSRRWKRIWSSMPLDLNLDSPDSDIRFLSAGSISSILSSHRGLIHRFCVNTLAGVGTRAWLETLAERHIDDTSP